MHKPSWFKPGLVAVSNASTCGINKDGEELFLIDPETGTRTTSIDDALQCDVKKLLQSGGTPSLTWVASEAIKRSGIAVPNYYDRRTLNEYRAERARKWPSYEDVTLGELVDEGRLIVRGGHGSPSADIRTGVVPYIKVSDIRAGQVNINPTNRISEVVARRYWRSDDSALRTFDLVTPRAPVRTSVI